MIARFSVPGERVELLPDMIDPDLFAPGPPARALAASLGIPDGAPVVVYLGSFEQQQGVDTILAAARQLAGRFPSAHFLIMGFPGERDWERRFREAGIAHAHFPGRIARRDAPAYLSLGTVALAPKREGSMQAHGKLLDYMAMGLPVVAFDNEANREMLGAGGCTVPQNDVAAFAEAVAAYLADPLRARTHGMALRERACVEFSSDAGARRLAGIYARLCPAAPKART